MGAGCSNGRALAVQDSVTKKITLTREGKDHLKNYSQNANLNTSKLKGSLNLLPNTS